MKNQNRGIQQETLTIVNPLKKIQAGGGKGYSTSYFILPPLLSMA